MLEAREISAGYGAAMVLRDLSLSVACGEIVALLGPNGAGKTTVLRALSGNLGLKDGSIRWDGEVTRDPLHRRARAGLSYVMEERAVFSKLTVIENLRVAGVEVDEVFALFPELKKRARLPAGRISGGEQQMLAVGRAFAKSPRILLVDELSMGLAPQVVRRILEAIRAKCDDGLGTLLVEQHVQQALEVADRVVVLRNGSIAMEGPASDFKTRSHELRQSYLGGNL